MFRWNNVDDQTIFGMTVKMYRDPFEGQGTFVVPFENYELDHYAYRHMGSEVYMYRVLDTNFVEYIEERGDLSRVKTVNIPTKEDTTRTIL